MTDLSEPAEPSAPADPAGEPRWYRNPVLPADFSDPDVIRVGDDYYLIASSFHRVPGIPVLHSRDLVDWQVIGHALPRLLPEAEFRVPRLGGGVWAPAIRYHADRFWIVYPDPDQGIFVVTAEDPAGPWGEPYRLKAGRGLIDPCPLWDTDGQAYLVHAWARSRAGFNNRLTAHRMSPDGRRLLDDGKVIIDGDALPGYHTLEGPKWYRRDNWYWLFAPGGGVATGWQSAFRARTPFGPYEHRIVLAQGDTDVNGPHQGAWVDDPTGGDWFLHFQDRGAYGRVVHLQPMAWQEDGWPVIGADNGSECGTPVRTHPRPPARAPVEPARLTGSAWTWQANPEPWWYEPAGPNGFRLACVTTEGSDLRRVPNVLGQRIPLGTVVATTDIDVAACPSDTRAGLCVLGDGYAWIGLERSRDAVTLVHRSADPGRAEIDAASPGQLPVGSTAVRLRVTVVDGMCQFAAAEGGGTAGSVGPASGEFRPVGGPFTATAGRWVGATLGLFATTAGDDPSEVGYAEVASFRLSVQDCPDGPG